MTADHASRRSAVRSLLAERELDALLVTDLLNIRYLTGFTGSNAVLLLVTDDPDETNTVVCTDGRYVTQVAQQVPDLRAEIARASAAHIVTEHGGRAAKWGFESHVVTVEERARWDRLDHRIRFTAAPGVVEERRAIKDEHEIGLIRQACGAADRALADLVAAGGLRAGRTEREVARDLEWRMFEHGADGISFETIVAAGANSAVPHHRPTEAILADGDFVKIDFGAQIGGYHSDMTRTYVLRRAADWQREVYDLVLRAQQAGRDALAPGVACADVDAAARSVIADAGHADLFLHGLGHGVGLEIHEAPGIGAAATGTLVAGATVTVEPGVYFSGRGGVRIEDTLVVRERTPELLTLTDKTLTVV